MKTGICNSSLVLPEWFQRFILRNFNNNSVHPKKIYLKVKNIILINQLKFYITLFLHKKIFTSIEYFHPTLQRMVKQ